jgi:glycerophosphoryl diester phosphodiesterase
MTNGTGKVSDITLEELKKLNLRASNFGKVTPYKVPTLEDVFRTCKGQIMINVDKAFWWMDDIEDLASQTGVTRQIIVKSYEDKTKIDERLGAFPFVYFMPIISENNFNNVENLPSFMNKKNSYLPEAYELIFDEVNDAIFQPTMIETMREYGGRIWVNTLSDGLCGGYSERQNTQQNWDTLIQKGVNIIQTDSTLLLKSYLLNRNSIK